MQAGVRTVRTILWRLARRQVAFAIMATLALVMAGGAGSAKAASRIPATFCASSGGNNVPNNCAFGPKDKTALEKMQKSAGKSYGISFLASLVSAFVLAKIILVFTVNSALYGMKVGFAVWLGWVF